MQPLVTDGTSVFASQFANSELYCESDRWMTKSQDIVFNGDMINVTFKVKETTPDGNYVISIQ